MEYIIHNKFDTNKFNIYKAIRLEYFDIAGWYKFSRDVLITNINETEIKFMYAVKDWNGLATSFGVVKVEDILREYIKIKFLEVVDNKKSDGRSNQHNK
ncbi:hypothetical protein [Clostridioides difficile]|uniref:hypothetical protein n=1 Tax=Clostridioides difficile TaxID=1496 RepID=UPI000BB77BA3|nr:hypothetical protein [Clostridioides difficile]EGT3815317.1 hypothetical protein [Clostridioides difficile]EGT4203024.1 hypothetical protein [Clostridioides difficile]ELX4570470.1 hypothetical protein [Clostridioides difficile]MBY1421662.1 hypothetical protein [Clostridioides difficile]MBY1824139.1 hypothetical protein [Clostridioides difficile]